jgi:hypothetical protein
LKPGKKGQAGAMMEGLPPSALTRMHALVGKEVQSIFASGKALNEYGFLDVVSW